MPPNWLLLNAARNQLLLKLGGFNRLTVQKKKYQNKIAFQWKGIHIFKRNDRIVRNIKRLVEQQQSAWTSKHVLLLKTLSARTTSPACRTTRREVPVADRSAHEIIELAPLIPLHSYCIRTPTWDQVLYRIGRKSSKNRIKLEKDRRECCLVILTLNTVLLQVLHSLF